MVICNIMSPRWLFSFHSLLFSDWVNFHYGFSASYRHRWRWMMWMLNSRYAAATIWPILASRGWEVFQMIITSYNKPTEKYSAMLELIKVGSPNTHIRLQAKTVDESSSQINKQRLQQMQPCNLSPTQSQTYLQFKRTHPHTVTHRMFGVQTDLPRVLFSRPSP